MNSPSYQNFTRGLIRENPTLVMLLGMCPTLGVTTSALNGLGMGLATLFVLLLSNTAVSAVKNFIPAAIRIPCYITIIASFVTVVELLLAAYFPALHAALGIYIPQSILDALGMGLGFTWALLALGLIREILGAGSAFGFSFVGEDAYPVLLFIMPPGAFLALAGLIVVFNWLRRK